MSYQFKPGTKILRRPAVKETTGLSDSSLERGVREGTFPKPIQLGARAVGWPDFAVYEWLNEQAKKPLPSQPTQFKKRSEAVA
jgi:prophage regulatory protein